MFFIGVFGINDSQKPIGTYNNTVCPSCGALTHFEIFKSYTYFHFFFIPLFKWNVKYFLKTACCGNLYGLEHSIGAKYERGEIVEIRNENIYALNYNEYFPFKICRNCGLRFDSNFSYCPHCGSKL